MAQRQFCNEDLLALHAQGQNDQEIAQALGVTGDAVAKRRQRLGLASNYTPQKVTDAAILALHAQGKNDQEIAKSLGVAGKTIFVHRRKLGLESNWSAKSPRPAQATPTPRPKRRPKPKPASHIRVEASGIQDAPRPPRPVGDYAQRVRLLQQLWERTQAGQTAAMLRRMEGV